MKPDDIRLPSVPMIGPRQVSIDHAHILGVAAVDVVNGSLGDYPGNTWLRVVDIPNCTAMYVPMPDRMVMHLLTELSKAVHDDRQTNNLKGN